MKLAIGYDFEPGAFTKDTDSQDSIAGGKLDAIPEDAAEILSKVGSMNEVPSPFCM